MEINVLIGEGLETCPDESWLRGIAEQVLIAQDVDPQAELGLVIIGQEEIRRLNKKYLGRDRPTDVLSFSMLPELSAGDWPEGSNVFVQPPDEILHLGEVIISYPQAAIQAEEHRHSVKREMAILIIHGILHLFGYDHEEPGPRRQMSAKEKEILGNIEGALN